MKTAGILIMAVSLAALGFSLADRFRLRLTHLQNLRQMVSYLKGMVLYSNAALPEALNEIGGRFSDGPCGRFLLRVAERLERGSGSFERIWMEELQIFSGHVPLRDQDLEALETLGKHLGYADRAMQERTMLFYLEQTDEAIAELKAEAGPMTKLYCTLGLASGVLLAVLLI